MLFAVVILPGHIGSHDKQDRGDNDHQYSDESASAHLSRLVNRYAPGSREQNPAHIRGNSDFVLSAHGQAP